MPPPPPPPPPIWRPPPAPIPDGTTAPMIPQLRLNHSYECNEVAYVRALEFGIHGFISLSQTAAAVIKMAPRIHQEDVRDRLYRLFTSQLQPQPSRRVLDALVKLLQGAGPSDEVMTRLETLARTDRKLRYALYPKNLSPSALNAASTARSLSEFCCALRALELGASPADIDDDNATTAHTRRRPSPLTRSLVAISKQLGGSIRLEIFPRRPDAPTFYFWLQIKGDNDCYEGHVKDGQTLTFKRSNTRKLDEYIQRYDHANGNVWRPPSSSNPIVLTQTPDFEF